MNIDRAGRIGAASGFAAFLVLGAVPSAALGGSAGAMITAMLRGTALDSAFLVRTLVLGGMVVGAACAGTVFVLGGMVCAMALDKLLGDGQMDAPRPVRKVAAPPVRSGKRSAQPVKQLVPEG